jgi:NDP-sugar pyrophosphorylase family protein
MKGFVPAAGLGTRLAPLTKSHAKPALPFLGIPTLYFSLWHLKAAGIDSVAINTHYLPKTIEALVRPGLFGLSIKLSHEPEILGTGGAHNPLQAWRGDDDLLVYNPDVISDIDLKKFLREFNDSGHIAAMVVLDKIPQGKFCMAIRGNEVAAFQIPQDGVLEKGLKRAYGAAVYVLSKRFFKYVEKSGSFSVIDSFEAATKAGESVGAFFHKGVWFDMGESVKGYWQSQLDILSRSSQGVFEKIRYLDLCAALKKPVVYQKFSLKTIKLEEPVLIFGQSLIESQCHLGPAAVVCEGANIGQRARLKNCLILGGAKILPGENLENLIVSGDLRISLL